MNPFKSIEQLGPEREPLNNKRYKKVGRFRVMTSQGEELAWVDYYSAQSFYATDKKSGATSDFRSWGDVKKHLVETYPGSYYRHD